MSPTRGAPIAAEKDALTLRRKEPRILILGSGDSGKTTFLKQLKILHGGGFSEEERQMYRNQIYLNIADCVLAIMEATLQLDCTIKNQEIISKMETIVVYYQGHSADSHTQLTIPHSIAELVRDVWADEDVQSAMKMSNKFAVPIQDTAAYFLGNVMRFANPEYVPTNEDFLQIRHPTMQISETILKIQDVPFHFFDVGGQVKHRKLWTPYFDNVHNIVFVASISSYNQQLEEDPAVNRVVDAIELFGSICNHPLLKHIPVVLFLNKLDLFKQKIETSPIEQFFPEYPGKFPPR
nr:guanine nucleotide-binding protein subunit alpha [Polyrhizophydium stewartii]